MDWLTYIPVVITGISAVIAALLNTEIDEKHPEKKSAAFRKPTTVGWALIILTICSTLAGIGIERKHHTDQNKSDDLAKIQKKAIDEANKKLEKQGSDLEQAKQDLAQEKQDLVETKKNLGLSLEEQKSQGRFMRKEATDAGDRAQKQSSELAAARADLQHQQEASFVALRDEQNHHQKVLLASLLGHIEERPQSVLQLNTPFSITEEEMAITQTHVNNDREVVARKENEGHSQLTRDDSDVLAHVIFDKFMDRLENTSCVLRITGHFAPLKANIVDPTKQTVEYGWTLYFCADLKDHRVKTGGPINLGGPQNLIGPVPELQVEYDKSHRLVVTIRSRLRKALPSAVLFKGYPLGATVAELDLNTKNLPPEFIDKIFSSSSETFLIGGQQLTLVDSSAGLCAVANLEKPVIEVDRSDTNIKMIWKLKETNQLVFCPEDSFFLIAD